MSVRALARLLVLFAALVLINFLIPRALPGDPLGATLAGSADGGVPLTPEARAELARYYALDLPLDEQFARYIGGLARGDLGRSISAQRPVAVIVAGRLPWSVVLGGLALVLAAAIGGILGVRAASRGRRGASGLTAAFVALGALPEFVVGLVLLVVFAVALRALPGSGAVTPFAACGGFGGVIGCAADAAAHLVLPLATLVLAQVPAFYLVMRAAALAQADEPYVVTARAKGLDDRTVALRHVARNAVIPFVALFGARAGSVVGGVVIVETLFAYPGIGQLTFEAIRVRDYPVLQAVFLVTGAAVLLATAASDTLLPLLDPRLRMRAT